MKILKMTRGIIKRILNNESSPSRRRIAAAFIAGMAVSASLATTPIAAGIFSPRLIQEPAAPALPTTPDSLKTGSSPDISNPVIPYLPEPAFTVAGEAVLSC